MTKFEQVGVNRQYEASNLREAKKAFNHSCTCCCNKGIKLECDKCTISYVHNLIVAYYDDKEKQN